MKLTNVLFVIAALGLSTCAFADWGRPPPPPGWGHPPPPPGWGGSCEVIFDKCDFAISGFCVKWNNKSITVDRRDAYYGCDIAARQYGRLRNCRVNCQ